MSTQAPSDRTNGITVTPVMRVERALRVLPEVDVLTSLRALVIASSRGTSSDAPHATVGKRTIRPGHLPELLPDALSNLTDHLRELFAAAVSALEAEAAGDTAGAAMLLLDAGNLEERIGRESAAQAWYEHALAIAADAFDRQPEIRALLALAEVDLDREALEPAARRAQRAFTLAEAGRHDAEAARASLALGRIAARSGTRPGATAWLTRGLELAGGTPALTAHFQLELAKLSDASASADDALRRLRIAEGEFSAVGDSDGLALVRVAEGRILAGRGEIDAALQRFLEALEHVHRGTRHPRVECSVRRALAEALLAAGRLVEAEDEARIAEDLAVSRAQGRELVRLYLVLGAIRAAQFDETGFVFYEKAIELSRGPTPTPGLEALSYAAYAEFRRTLGDAEDARNYDGRAAEIREQLDVDWLPGR